MAKVMQKRLAGWATSRRAASSVAPLQQREGEQSSASGLWIVSLHESRKASDVEGWAIPDRTARRLLTQARTRACSADGGDYSQDQDAWHAAV